MARVTIEDCLSNVKNRFELVLVAAKRTREITLGGSDPHIPWDNDKPTVVALREIAAGDVTAEILEDKVKHTEPEMILEIAENPALASAADASSEEELLVVAGEQLTSQDNLTHSE